MHLVEESIDSHPYVVALRALPRKEDAGIRKACLEVGVFFQRYTCSVAVGDSDQKGTRGYEKG